MLCLLMCGGMTTTLLAQDVDRQLAYLPANLNTIAIVRVQPILNSPRAQREQWSTQSSSEFLAGSIQAGSTVDLIVRGMEFHPEDSQLSQAVSIYSYGKSLSWTQLAKRENGHLDKIGDKTAIHSP